MEILNCVKYRLLSREPRGAKLSTKQLEFILIGLHGAYHSVAAGFVDLTPNKSIGSTGVSSDPCLTSSRFKQMQIKPNTHLVWPANV
jgi:hypothetical protein